VATDNETPLRKDAQRNREAILAAARDLYAERADVPMCEIARHAGVGQATLYRNFPDCRNLVAALIVEQMEQTEELAAEHAGDPDAFFVLIRNVVETMARFHALGELAREDACLGSALDHRRRRLAELMRKPLRTAMAAGTLRRAASRFTPSSLVSLLRGEQSPAKRGKPRITQAMLSSLGLLGGFSEPTPGIEPGTPSLRVKCSTS
jgi:AcrR family transcriptional regulator